MPCKYYSSQRPLDRGCYPDTEGNPALEVINYEGRIEIGAGKKAWGHVVYAMPLPQPEKEHYGFFDDGDADGTAELDRRAKRIAKAIERKGGIPRAEAYEAVRPMLADASEALEMSDREIVAAMLDYYGVAVA